MKKIVIFLLFFYSISSAKFFPAEYMGYQKLTKSITLEELENPLFNNPAGAAIMKLSDDVRVTFVVDEGWHRVIYAREGRDWIKAYGEYGGGSDGLKCPLGCTADEDRNLYIADCGNHRIVKLYFLTDPIDSIKQFLQYQDAFTLNNQGVPWDVTYWDNAIYVTDCSNHCILKYSTSGELLSTYGSYGSVIGQFYKPQGIAVIRDTVYIADMGNRRVVALKDNGINYSWLRTRYLTELTNPYIQDVEVDNDGGVYVVDHLVYEIFKFAPGLTTLLDRFGCQDNIFRWPRFVEICSSDVVITEEWGNSSGIQYYSIKSGVVSVSLTSDTIDLTERDFAIWFMLDGTAYISVKIKQDFSIVRELSVDSLMEFGGHQIYWDGLDSNNNLVLPGNYIVEIVAVDPPTTDTVCIDFTVKGTVKSGTIPSDESWTLAGEPYVLAGDVNLDNNVRLSIDPGVRVMPTGDYRIRNYVIGNGKLIARGTALNEILFTPHRKIGQDSLVSGSWRGIQFNFSDSLILDYCVIEGAGSYGAAVSDGGGVSVISNSRIYRSADLGFYSSGDNYILNDNTFEENFIPIGVVFSSIYGIGDNEYENNTINKIAVYPGVLRKNMLVEKHEIPYWFRKTYAGDVFEVYGDETYIATLTIEPGTQIEFDNSTLLRIGKSPNSRGRLVSIGTMADSIRLTIADSSILDTRFSIFEVGLKSKGASKTQVEKDNGSRRYTNSNLLYWRGMRFEGLAGDTSEIKYTSIEYAGLDTAAIIFGDSASLNITDSRIYKSKNYGIWMQNTRPYDNLLISNCLFEEDSIPARCLFTGAGGFGEENEYLNNTINKIEVYPCSLRYDMTIKKQEIPYWFKKTGTNKDFEVYGDTNYVATLTIESGTHIEFEDSTVLKIGHDYRMGMYWYNQRGRLICEGLEDDSIRLTIANDTLLPLGSLSKASKEVDNIPKSKHRSDNPLFWRGLRFDYLNRSIDTSVIKYTSIEYAGLDTAAIIYGDSTSISIIDSRIFKSKKYGIWMPKPRPYDNLVISNCLFEEDSIPVRTAFNNLTDLYTCSFSNNIVNAIEVVPYYYGFEWRDIIIHHQDVPYWFLSIPSMDWKEFSFYGGVDHCASVTIEPGTRMLFADSTLLRGGYPGYSWRAKIIAMGTEQDSIIFSALDTISGWRGIQMNSYDVADTSIFEYCRISYGGQEVPTGLPGYKFYGNLVFFKPHIAYILKNSILSHSKTIGLNGPQVQSNISIIPIIKNNEFSYNDSFPLVIWANVLRELKNNIFIENKNNEIYVYSERINKSLVWQNQGVPYIVDGQMNVDGHGDTTVTLEIESGNVIKFKQDKQLWILEDDRLLAHSTKFTGADSLPWNQIYFRNADSSLIDSCVIEYAHKTQYSYPGAVCIKDNSIVAITNSLIINNEYGIYIRDDAPSVSSVEIINNKIFLNETGIYNSNSESQVYVKYNEFFGNKCAFRNDVSSNIIQADSNWWGHASGPWDPSEGLPDYNPGGEGDSIGDYVQYRPWLTSPVQPSVVTLIQPNGAETLYCETDYEIKWTRNLKGNSGQLRVDYPSPLPSPTRGEGIQILRQELYYTTDFPEGGGLKGDFFWVFIDTVAVSETSYVWQVPVVSSDRCRVAIVLYYENTLIDADNNTDLHGMLNEYELRGTSTNNEIASPVLLSKVRGRNDNVEKGDKETWRQGETETERNGDTETGRQGVAGNQDIRKLGDQEKTQIQDNDLNKEMETQSMSLKSQMTNEKAQVLIQDQNKNEIDSADEKKVVENKLFDDYDGPGTIMIAVDISDANFSIIPIYTLTIYTIGQGTVIKNPDLLTFLEGTVCTLSAIPEPHWEFAQWSDSLSGSDNPETIIMDSDKIVTATFTPSGYVLNLDSFPMYQAESLPGYNEMCGPAVAQMALNYMFWNNITDSAGPPMLPEFAQELLYTYGIEHNADPESVYFDLQGMWHTIQDKKPMPYSEYGYNFTKRHNTDQYTMLKFICQWIDYTVGTYGGHKDGYPYHVPSIVPAYGNYTNWMAVRGIHTDTAAYPMPDTLTIYGFWVNDPYPASMGGVGENSYKIISDWNSIYYLSMTVGDYIDEYLAVLEPPESVEGCYLILAEPIIRFNDQQMNQLNVITDRSVTQGDINQWIIQAAIDGVTEELIPYDEKFEEIFRTTVPGVPLLVRHLNNDDYYMVPFIISSPRIKISSQEKSVVADKLRIASRIRNVGSVHDDDMSLVTAEDINANTLVVILIDADDGSFKEASWADTPVKYLPISKTEARQIASDTAEELGLEVTDINDLHPELIYRKSTPYYPEWCVIIEEYAIYISQDGTVTVEEPGKDGKGTGGVMSEEGALAYSLNTAAPTPFVNSTTISYSIARPGRVSLNIYDISGRLIKTLVDENMDAGAYRLEWYGYDNNNHKVTPGVYFIKLTSDNFRSIKKVIFVR